MSISPELWSPLILQLTQIGLLHSKQNNYNFIPGCTGHELITLGFSVLSVRMCLEDTLS